MLYGIQSYRAIAALLVVLYHSSGNLAKDKYFGSQADYLVNLFAFGGQAGVAFFFVLSGFIIHHVHTKDFNEPKKIPEYLKKRILRVYPTYIIIFLLVYVLALATPSLRGTMPTDFSVLAKSLLLLPQDLNVVGGTGAPVIVVAWSLQYEMMFYLIFTLALIRKEIFYLACAVVFGFLVANGLSTEYSFPRSFVGNHLVSLFGMGMIASACVNKKEAFRHYSALAIVGATGFIATAIAVSVLPASQVLHTVGDLSYGLFSALLILGTVLHEKAKNATMLTRYVARLGDSSYALYLLHFPIVAVLSKITASTLWPTKAGAGFAFFLLVAGSTAAAFCFNRYLERPLINHLAGKAKIKSPPIIQQSASL